MLIPFIVIIETISNLNRPGTLAVCLTANVIAGHLLLTLVGNYGPSIRHTLLSVLITAQILLLIQEAAVAVIQTYVFAILRTLYSREVNVNTQKPPIPYSTQNIMTTHRSYWSNSYPKRTN
jgi:F-type H+-transporting ATPase subunit a